MVAFYATFLAIGALLRVKVAPTLRVLIDILYFLPSFFYLVLLYAFPGVPLSSLGAAESTDPTCIFGLQGSCWIAVKPENIIDRLSPLLLLALW
jgi:hypothetical protein